ncbi:hypothetical protein EK21DRAFT_112366 [Setomelanomma holmii]|uniref:F-box domain-containing protein n=1 Tax=Setomelanomma holmii TaxID=210430 RepID=A0A9P4LMB9_9PLEO|nr:hypothetical protein EK21DRAFT_112366 [Setomelanomma holmii]
MDSRTAYLHALSSEIQTIVFGFLDRGDLVNIIKTHRELKAQAERLLYRHVVLPFQSTTTAPFNRNKHLTETEDDYLPTANNRLHQRDEQHQANRSASGPATLIPYQLP